jgi:hypothetical protein
MKLTRLIVPLLALTAFNLTLHPAQAQDNQPLLLPLNQTISGSVTPSDTILYAFDVPAHQDVMVTLDSTPAGAGLRCPAALPLNTRCLTGAQGGNKPIYARYRTAHYPSTGALQHIELQVTSPGTASARYQITAHASTPQILAPGVHAITPTAAVQNYALEIDATAPFTVTVEEPRPNGDFLWVACEPYIYRSTRPTASGLLPFGTLDEGRAGNATAPLQFMTLGSAANQLHLAIGMTAPYLISVTPLDVSALNANQRADFTVSYRQPLQVARLDAHAAGAAQVDAQVTQGAAALVSAYTVGNPQGSYLTLGIHPDNGQPLPLADSMQHDVTADTDTYLVVQVPPVSTRDPATVALRWQPLTSTSESR